MYQKGLHPRFFQFLIRGILAATIVLNGLPSFSAKATDHDISSQSSALALKGALSPQEKAWLKEHQTIRIAGPRSFPPFHYFEKNGILKGMSADYIRIIMKSLGVQVEIQQDLPWPEVLKRAQHREVDLISCSARTADREAYLSFTQPYLSFPMVIISRKDAPFIGGLDDLHGKKVAVVKRVAVFEWLQRDNIGIDPHFTNSPLQDLEAVSFGQADATIENLAAASYLIQKNGLTNLKIAAPTPYNNYNLYIAVRSDWPELVGILNKALDAIPPERHSAIRNNWLSVRYEYGLQTIDILKWVLLVVSIATIILAVFWAWNRRLKGEIAERKKAKKEREELIMELRGALEKIKALKGLLPICAKCKKIRDDKGYWNQIENYIEMHSDALFSHSVCPDCAVTLYSNTKWYKNKVLKEES